MTAQEKAKEIVDKFLNCYWDNFGTEYAKLCAKVLVDEIIDPLNDRLDCDVKFYQEVKKEIEAL